MNRKRLVVIGVVALVVAATVSWKMLTVVQRSSSVSAATNFQVVVAARDLNVGQEITDADVQVVNMQGGAIPDRAFHEVKDVLGRGVVIPMVSKEPVLDGKVAKPNEGFGLPSMITSGMRAVSVKVNDVVSVAGFVAPGTHVDVLVTGSPINSSDQANVTTTTVLQNVEVLAAGKKLERDNEGKAMDVPVITLLVSPADAQLLTLAAAQGKIQLALRNRTDVDKGSTTPVRNTTLYGATPPAAHSPKVAAGRARKEMAAPVVQTYAVEVIRGDKREVTKFESQ